MVSSPQPSPTLGRGEADAGDRGVSHQLTEVRVINCNLGYVLYSIEIIKAAVQVISIRSPTLTLASAFLSATREL